METRINGNAYDWDNISLSIDGEQIYGITSIKWTSDREFSNNYGAGHIPVSQGYGNWTFEASMTISMEEMGKLVNRLATITNGDVNNLLDKEEFNVIIQYGNYDETKSHNVTLENCRFHNFGADTSQNDMNIEVEVNLNPANVLHTDWIEE